VHAEDHPIEYIDFEGDIPKGEYGAGTMKVWDSGTYECHKWRDDEAIVTFHGRRVNGRYALFRAGDDPKDCMIHRMDTPADPGAAARLALGGARRRDRGVRRARPPELRAAPAPHASGGRQPHSAAGAGDPRHLRDLRPPLPGRPLVDAAALRGAPRTA